MSQVISISEWRAAPQTGPVAVLVDGSCVGHDAAARILDMAESLGPVAIRRVYADVTRHRDWSDDPRFNPIHAVHRGTDRANLFLVMDAIQLAETGRAASFVIAAGEGDFGPVVSRLRDLGCRVLSLGPAGPAQRASRAPAAVLAEDCQPPAAHAGAGHSRPAWPV